MQPCSLDHSIILCDLNLPEPNLVRKDQWPSRMYILEDVLAGSTTLSLLDSDCICSMSVLHRWPESHPRKTWKNPIAFVLTKNIRNLETTVWQSLPFFSSNFYVAVCPEKPTRSIHLRQFTKIDTVEILFFLSSVQRTSFETMTLKYQENKSHLEATVDGRNPAPPGMVKTL